MTDEPKVLTLPRSHRTTASPPRDVLSPFTRDVAAILEDRAPIADRVARIVNALTLASVALFMDQHKRLPRGEDEIAAALDTLLSAIAAQLRAHLE